jgi:AAA+ ATPase superfamily predicted ATPase
VAIIGPRKIGKTSLVLEAARRAHSPSLRVVVLDTQEQSPVSGEVFRHLALRVLDAAFASEVGESLERLIHSPAGYRAALLRSENFGKLSSALRSELLEIPEGQVTDERIHSWLDAPERLAEALGLWIVVALDEFQELAGLSPKDFALFARLRSVWQRHRRVAYFISGSARSMLLALVTEEASPFFQHFSILELGPFTRDAAIELLRRPGGTVVPMSVIGDEAEQVVARELSAMGFDLVYQSRASRGAFDLLATRAAAQLGVHVERSSLPLRFTKAEWSRMTAEAAELTWRWVVAAVAPDGTISILDPGKPKRGREVRLDASATIENLLQWIDRKARRS